MLVFREADQNDIFSIRQLAHTIWHSHYPGIITVDQIDYMLDKMYSVKSIKKELEKDHKWVLVYLEDKPIGFISYYFEKKENKVKLSKLYLLPSYHGFGFGQMSLEYVKKCTKDLGASALYLTVNKKNKKAIDAYVKSGFVIEKGVVMKIGKGFVMDDYIMVFKF